MNRTITTFAHMSLYACFLMKNSKNPTFKDLSIQERGRKLGAMYRGMSDKQRRELIEFQKTTVYPKRQKILSSTRALAKKFKIPVNILNAEFHQTPGSTPRLKLAAIARRHNIPHHRFSTRQKKKNPTKLQKLAFLSRPKKTVLARAVKTNSSAVKVATERALRYLSRTNPERQPEIMETPVDPADPLADATSGDAELPSGAIVDIPETPPDPLSDPAPVDDPQGVIPQGVVVDGPVPDPLDDVTKADDHQPTEKKRARPCKN